MMRIAVTGGAGFIGHATIRRLIEDDHHVYVADNLQQRVHPLGWPNAIVDLADVRRHHDVRNPQTWVELFQWEPDAILHLAAYQDYMTDYSTFIETNVTSTALLFERAREIGWRGQVVVASSSSVLGEGQYSCRNCQCRVAATSRTAQDVATHWGVRCAECQHLVTNPTWAPESFTAPVTAYGVSKLGEEKLALALGAQLEIPTVALRYSIVQGPGQSPWNAYSGVMRAVCLQLLAKRDVMLFEDGNQLRDYVSIHDVVDANVRALRGSLPSGAYHVGGASDVTVRHLALVMREVSNVDVDVKLPGWFRVGDVRHTLSNTKKLRDQDWVPLASRDMMNSTWVPYWEWLSSLDLDASDIVERAFGGMRRSGVLIEVGR